MLRGDVDTRYATSWSGVKGGMAVVGERGRATKERVVGRILVGAGGRSSSEDFMVDIGLWWKNRHSVSDSC